MDGLGSTTVEIIGLVIVIVVLPVVRFVVDINIFGSRRLSISRDIIVADILRQGLMGSVAAGSKNVTYMFENVDVTPLEIGAASCRQAGITYENCRRNKNLCILPGMSKCWPGSRPSKS